MTSQPRDGYKVKVEDGAILFYSGKGLERQTQSFLEGSRATWANPSHFGKDDP